MGLVAGGDLMARTTPVLASVLLIGAALGLVLSSSVEAVDRATAHFDPRDCASRYTEGGTVDYFGSESSDTVAQALTRGEAALLRADLRGAKSSLTVDAQDRKVWTYYMTTGASVAEIVLERAGDGWRMVSAQQCAPDGVAEIQEETAAPSKKGP
jgi:hypothetical protein